MKLINVRMFFSHDKIEDQSNFYFHTYIDKCQGNLTLIAKQIKHLW